MVLILNEEKAAKIFHKYPDVAAFTLGKSKKGFHDAKIELSYDRLAFLPDEDTINAVLGGDIKGNKVIAKAVKKVYQPDDPKGNPISIGMTQLISMIADADAVPDGMSKKKYKKYIRHHGPNILVFVLDGENRARDKFLTKFIAALFDVYGYKAITNTKKLKKVFKGKRSTVAKNVRAYVENTKGMSLSKEGRKVYRVAKLYYATEILQNAMSKSNGVIKLNRENSTSLAHKLAMCFSCRNNAELDKLNVGKKPYKMIYKKNKVAFKAYNELRKILKVMDNDLVLPKVEFGCTKKSKKKGNPKPKMNVDKFIKFFRNADNRPLLRLVYAHLACRLFDVAVGSSEYCRHVSDSIAKDFPSEFIKKFNNTAKVYANSASGSAKA